MERSRGENSSKAEPANSPKTDPPPRIEKDPWYKKPSLVGILMVVVLTALVGGVLLWRHSRKFQKTDDAVIDVVSEHVSSQVAGKVLRVLVNDNQDVNAGDSLVEIDPADYETKVKQVSSQQLQAAAQLAQAQAQQAVSEAQVEQAKADETVAQANSANALSELKRYEELRTANPGAVSQQQLDNASAAAKSSAAQALSAAKKVRAAEAQLQFASSQIEAAKAGLKSAEAQIEQAQLTVSYTKIKAALSGRIATKTVAPGNYVQPGIDLMAVVPKEVYVTANFKETQLARIRRGQTAEIKVDAYPDLKLKGHVEGIQPAGGQIFSVLPPQNASGNWVKIVQRVPVKILLDNFSDDPERRLAPGMSVSVKVRIR